MTPVLGVVGGGQLARMLHQAAIGLGVEVVVLCEDADAPAVLAGATHLPGRPDELADLVALAERCDAVTVDHERTPAVLLAELAALGHRVAPGARAAELGQDKVTARRVLGGLGVACAPWRLATSTEELRTVGDELGWPLVAKAPTGGYDGRGVWVLRDLDGARGVLDAWHARSDDPLLIEPLLPLERELAVLVVRGADGALAGYPPVETIQHHGRCDEVLVPARVPAGMAVRARHLAVAVAEAVDLVGAMALELFVVGDDLLLNELAVRTHNSGHLTIEACATSQFENHVRAALGLPLGSTALRTDAAAMVNVVGAADGSDPFDRLHLALAVPGAHVHRYAKDPRPGRKLGHITATAGDLDQARRLARRASAALTLPPTTAPSATTDHRGVA